MCAKCCTERSIEGVVASIFETRAHAPYSAICCSTSTWWPYTRPITHMLLEALGNAFLWSPISVFNKKKETAAAAQNARDWLSASSSAKQQLLTVDTSYIDSSDNDASTSDYASITPTVFGSNSERASHDAPASASTTEWQCCVWDWRSTHIGSFMKKQRLNALKRRLDQLDCCTLIICSFFNNIDFG